MNAGLSGAQLRHRKRLARVITILAGIVTLIAFFPLTGCASLENAPGARTTATPKNQASPWKLVWDDEFNGPAGAPPDQGKWSPDVGGNGWGNEQLEYDTDNQNVYQDGQGNLVLEARKSNPEGLQCWYGPCDYTSARITTSGHFSFTYGRLEARIKIPYGQGLWSGLWLLGSNVATVGWPLCGEVDIMENIGMEPASIHGSVHGPGNLDDTYTLFSNPYTLPHGAFADGFHTFALQWDPGHLSFFVDGMNYATFDRTSLTDQRNWVFNHPFNIILDVAVGGGFPGNPDPTTVFPQKMYVSYVRLYQKK